MDNHRAAYNNDTYDFNRRMRTSRDFGQVHQKLVKKVHGFYKTNTELLADLIVMDYDELINDFGLTLNEARWETNSNHKFEIDTRYKFKCRPIPQKVEFDLETTLGTDLEGTDEVSFKDEILKVTMQPHKHTIY